MKIYLASSWKNESIVTYFASLLRSIGYEVDAFCDETNGRFVFNALDLPGDPSHLNHIEALQQPEFQKAFEEDKKWLDWADVCVLILPCGRSAHLEAGYAKGKGKGLIIMSNLIEGEWDVMYGFADFVIDIKSMNKLKWALNVLEGR